MQAMTKTTIPAAPPVPEFEEEFTAGLRAIFEEKIVFNQLLGLKITSIRAERVTGRIDMRPELIGHAAHHRIHGGVISAGLDAIGALAVMAAIGARHMDETPAQRLQRFYKLGTIDLRVDYLRPGRGRHFIATARVVRMGNRIAVTHMELANDAAELIATGSAAYVVG